MNRFLRPLALLFLSVPFLNFPPQTKAAESATPNQQKASDLVRQLGNDSYRVRERATHQLLRMGLAAKQALQEGADDPDPEIRRRCLDLLPAVLEADLKARVEAFVADTEGKKEHDLPGWPRFRKMVGADAPARQLFADMLKADLRLLEDVETHPDQAGDLFAARCQNLQQTLFGNRGGIGFVGNQEQIKLPDVATLLFVGSDPKVIGKTQLQSVYAVTNFLYQPSVRNALDPSKPTPFKKLLLAWMGQQTDPNVMTQLLYVTMNLNLKEGLDIAMKVAKDNTANAHTQATALMVIGKIGGKDHVSLLEPLLNDKKVLTNFNIGTERVTTEVRDVALAMAVQLTGQSHRDYGFPFTKMDGHSVFNYYSLGFVDDAQRDAAFKKWKDWNASQKK